MLKWFKNLSFNLDRSFKALEKYVEFFKVWWLVPPVPIPVPDKNMVPVPSSGFSSAGNTDPVFVKVSGSVKP